MARLEADESPAAKAPAPPPAPTPPALPSLRNLSRTLYVQLAEFSSSTEARPTEIDVIQPLMTNVLKVLTEIDRLIQTRHSLVLTNVKEGG